MKKGILLIALLTAFTACNIKTNDKPDYSNIYTLRDSLIVKTKFENENKDSLVFYGDGDSLVLSIEYYVDSQMLCKYDFDDAHNYSRMPKSEKEVRFEYFILPECSDTLLACVDYFFLDTIDIPDISVDLLKDDYNLEIYNPFTNTLRIKYKGGNPDVNTDILMDSIAKCLHSHLENNLHYYNYEIGTHYGSPIIDFDNSRFLDIRYSSAESAHDLYIAYLRAFGSDKKSDEYYDTYIKKTKEINDYEFRMKKYSK